MSDVMLIFLACLSAALCFIASVVCLAVAVGAAYLMIKQRSLKPALTCLFGLLFSGMLLVMALTLFHNRESGLSLTEQGIITEQRARSQMWEKLR